MFYQVPVRCPVTKTYLYNFDPLKPHFYIVKLGFTGVYIIFLNSAQNIDFWCLLEPPRQGGSNEYPQFMFCAEIWKISEFFFLSENFQFFLEIKCSIYLNRRNVFVMDSWVWWILSDTVITLFRKRELLSLPFCFLAKWWPRAGRALFYGLRHCVLSVIVCLPFIMVSSVGYVL